MSAMAKGFLSGCMLMAMIGIFLLIVTHYSNEAEAIKHNAAHYDPQTGAFTWNQ